MFDGDYIRDLEVDKKNRGKDIIEDFMIAVNGGRPTAVQPKEIHGIGNEEKPLNLNN